MYKKISFDLEFIFLNFVKICRMYMYTIILSKGSVVAEIAC